MPLYYMNDKQPKNHENSQTGYSYGWKQQNHWFHFDLISNFRFYRMSINGILVCLRHFRFKFCSFTMVYVNTNPKGQGNIYGIVWCHEATNSKIKSNKQFQVVNILIFFDCATFKEAFDFCNFASKTLNSYAFFYLGRITPIAHKHFPFHLLWITFPVFFYYNLSQKYADFHPDNTSCNSNTWK